MNRIFYSPITYLVVGGLLSLWMMLAIFMVGMNIGNKIGYERGLIGTQRLYCQMAYGNKPYTEIDGKCIQFFLPK